jgi:glutaredoxin 3
MFNQLNWGELMITKTKVVKVYSTPSCPWCVKAKDFLKAHKIKFEDIDVSADMEAAQEMIDKTGQMSVPVIDIDGEIVFGFDEARLKDLLHLR